jgi:hypothetical protein
VIQDAIELAGDFLPSSLIYLTGSHMFGLETPASDQDYTIIYYNPEDDRRVFRHFPATQHSAKEDQKMYSLRKFAEMIAKGNPNISEMVNLEPLSYASGWPYQTGAVYHRDAIRGFMKVIAPYVVTQNLASAYMGHMHGMIVEITRGNPTPKRLSHALRVAYCLEHLLDTQTLPDFRTFAQREYVIQIKIGEVNIHDAIVELDAMQASIRSDYEARRHFLPDNSLLIQTINSYFVDDLANRFPRR